MNLIAQFVKVIWSKEQRGGQAAGRRNSVANQQKLPPEIEKYAFVSGKALVHRIVYSHVNDFARPIADELLIFEIEKLKNIGCFQFKSSNNTLEVTYKWSEESGGAPARIKYNRDGIKMPFKEPAFKLAISEIGKAEYNGRFSDDEWRYEKLTLNIGIFKSFDLKLFLKTDYDKYYKQLADLW